MRTVIQRVSTACVMVDGAQVAQIGNGLLILVGLKTTDTEQDFGFIINKTVKLRIFQDEDNHMNKSVTDINGEILLVPQFTLYADCRKGNRPSFTNAMPPNQAEPLFNRFVELFKHQYPKVQSGIFQAYMNVQLHNDGPVTILLDSEKSF